MPELPEMETYRKLLSERVLHQPTEQVEINREKSVNIPVTEFIEKVKGRTIVNITRRAKHLLFYLDSGDVLLLHLMLGGWLYSGNETDKPKNRSQVILSFGSQSLYFLGLRLGYLHLLSNEEVEQKLANLGPEPLSPDFTEARLSEMLSQKRGTLKTTLVDQHFLSGIGNCYSDEICFDARILPLHKTNELDEPQRNQLFQSMQKVLREAIQFGGYMDNPFFKGDTLTGGYNDQCKVYDRENEACPRCGALIVKEMMNARKVFYCRSCQL